MKSFEKLIEIIFIIFLFLFSIYNFALYISILDNKPTPDYQIENDFYLEDIIILFIFVFIPFSIAMIILAAKLKKYRCKSKKIIAVIGPTASGKTSMAIKLAKKFNGEIVNTDSRQIYKYLDIGTAKGDVKKMKDFYVDIPKKFQIKDMKLKKLNVYDLEGTRIHLINILEPDKTLTLAQYQKLANCVIKDILKRNKIPILVGGTGLYIDSIVKDYKIPKVKPDMKLRKKLNEKSVDELKLILKEINIKKFKDLNNSDRNNPRRLIRIIEIEKNRGRKNEDIKYSDKYEALYIMPKRTRKELYERINKRAEIILESGLIEEVKGLIDKGYEFKTPAFTSISYPIVKDYIEGKINKKELLEKFRQGDRNYARRQRTWFKRYPFHDVEIKEAEELVNKFIS